MPDEVPPSAEFWANRMIPVLYRWSSPFAKPAGWQRWHSDPWYKEWERLAYEGRQYAEPRPYFPDGPEKK